MDLVPFRAAIEAGVPMIMVGHVSLPNIIGDSTPAPLSSAVVQGMLRDSLGYTGIVVTDSLSMGAITSYYTPRKRRSRRSRRVATFRSCPSVSTRPTRGC